MTAPVRKDYARALLIEQAQSFRRLLAVYAARFEKDPIAQHRLAEVGGECAWVFAYYAQEEVEEEVGREGACK